MNTGPDSNGRMPSAGLWRNSAFSKLFAAHVVSLLGTSLTSVALGLLAHELVGTGVAMVMGVTLTLRIAVVVFLSPFAGYVADQIGPKSSLLLADISRAVIVVGFFLASEVWHIYLLALLLNIAASLFTPVYKASIPNIVTEQQYPRALSFGSIAYDLATIAGPALAALLIAWLGFRGNFLVNGAAFLVSAVLIFTVRLPRPELQADRIPTGRFHGIQAMMLRPGLMRSLFLSARVSVVSGFVLVTTVHYVKNILDLPDSYYAWAMAAYGIGSVASAFIYGQMATSSTRNILQKSLPWGIFGALIIVAGTDSFSWLILAWSIAGAGQVVLGIHGNELLALHSAPSERSHIYAAHFSLSHMGWGISYPLAGWLTSSFGFGTAALLFAAFFLILSVSEILFFLHRPT